MLCSSYCTSDDLKDYVASLCHVRFPVPLAGRQSAIRAPPHHSVVIYDVLLRFIILKLSDVRVRLGYEAT